MITQKSASALLHCCHCKVLVLGQGDGGTHRLHRFGCPLDSSVQAHSEFSNRALHEFGTWLYVCRGAGGEACDCKCESTSPAFGTILLLLALVVQPPLGVTVAFTATAPAPPPSNRLSTRSYRRTAFPIVSNRF